MRIGTRSLLFGSHQFLLHPLLVALAWTRLFGLPLDGRLWCAFFLHDIGYFSCADIDGETGRRHPIRGAAFMRLKFGLYPVAVLNRSIYLIAIFALDQTISQLRVEACA